MKSLPQKQMFVLQRFVQLNQIPINCDNNNSQKKIILLKNIYNQQKCIMKIQPKSILDSKERNILHQASFYQKFQGHVGVPLMIWSGQDFDCLVLVLQQQGISLYNRLKFYCQNKRMRLKDVCMIGIQIFQIIKNFHQKDYLHKNITPQTFSFGKNQKGTKIYVNDLLYMKKYRAKNNLNHIQQKQRVRFQFLTPFQSKNVLQGKQASRRDDIISIVYLLSYLLEGKLPWQQDWQQDIAYKKQQIIQINQKQDINFVFQIKPKNSQDIVTKIQRMKTIQQSLTPEQLCHDLPKQIKQILILANQLEFTQEPQYYRYIALLKKILLKNKWNNDLLFQWMQSRQNLQTNLKVDRKILNFSTCKTKEIQYIVYAPYQQKVSLDLSYEQNIKKSIKLPIQNIHKIQEYHESNEIKETNKEKKQLYKKNRNCQLI